MHLIKLAKFSECKRLGSVPLGSVDLPVLQFAKYADGDKGADKGEPHVFLGIPNVTLHAEKFSGTVAKELGGDPLDQFAACADAERGKDNQKEKRGAAPHLNGSPRHFARKERHGHALQKVADTVVVIATEVELFFEPIKGRDT